VPPGEYVFRVKAANSDGMWTQKALVVHISPPWWHTRWAYALFLITFAGIFLGGWKYLLRGERMKNEQKLKQVKAEQLLEIERLKSRFFANISHEFRTPLTLILSPLEKKLHALNPDHPEQSDFQLMHRNAQRLLQLVNQLLDLSKLDAGKMTLETRPGDLLPFFRRITASFLSLAETRNIHFRVHCPPGSLWVCFDADKLEKILNNLLSNAFKFTADFGEISVFLQLKPAPTHQNLSSAKACIQAEFCVQDSGIGIAPAQLERIFERFHQVDNTLTREQEKEQGSLFPYP
jgi:signal transduction histidine kinase